MDTQGIRVIGAGEFECRELERYEPLKRPRGNRGGRTKVKYLDVVTAFDIETSSLRSIRHSFMYIWQWAFSSDFVVIGRTWYEYRTFVEMLAYYLRSKGLTLVTYVHNLSYEFQFISGIYDFKPEDVFAVKSRRVLKCMMEECIEYRCSYLQTNMSLGMFLDKMQVPMQKLNLDYSVLRTGTTELSDDEIAYCIADVLGLTQAIDKEMTLDDDTLYTIPYTSTGYVRRDVKAVIKKEYYNHVRRLLPDWELYCLLREAFRGGDTHANRYYVGHILHDIRAYDRSSSYPDVLVNHKYPVTPFKRIGRMPVEEMVKWLDGTYAFVCRVSVSGLRLRDQFNGSPYISLSKCRAINPKDRDGLVIDNGRVLECRYTEMTVTDIDLKIILRDYDFDDIDFYDVWYSKYGYLPGGLRELICHYYKGKTELKGIPEQVDFYNKFKNLINAIYGLMAQDPVKDNILYKGGEFEDEGADPKELLKAHNRTAFLPYQWGVWTTAWARWELREAIWMAGNLLVYHDTDSVYTVDVIDMSVYNKKVRSQSKANGGWAKDVKGGLHYLGEYEQDETKERFITWGAKKYAYESDGLHITISGVGKTEGAKELEAEGGIEALVPGFVFKGKAGGFEVVYNDITDPFYFELCGEREYITKNTYMEPSTYRLNITNEYDNLLGKMQDVLAKNWDIIYNKYIKNKEGYQK